MKVEDIVCCCEQQNGCVNSDGVCPVRKECEALKNRLKDAEPHELDAIMKGDY